MSERLRHAEIIVSRACAWKALLCAVAASFAVSCATVRDTRRVPIANPPADVTVASYESGGIHRSFRLLTFVESEPVFVVGAERPDVAERAYSVGLRVIVKRAQRVVLSVVQARDEPHELASAVVRRAHDGREDEVIDLVVSVLHDDDGWLGVWRNEPSGRALVAQCGLGLSEFVSTASLDWYFDSERVWGSDGWRVGQLASDPDGIWVPVAFSWYSSELDEHVRGLASDAANCVSGSVNRGGVGGVRLPNGWLTFERPQPPPAKLEWSPGRIPLGSVWLELAVIGGHRE